ncbi:hypothetical protein G7054_g2052 [Neopestalotiopsis clavispora]|nr:hypothetical protein G7054_g2052 [Neopestalotiopsis clavispora]
MSGFEVLGVVLGTIPLVISALEHYQEGLHTIRRWRSYEAELKSLKRSLGNEKAILVNTCQQLLSGVVSSIDLEKLVDEPFGELWSNALIEDQIALRLDHVYEPFKATVVAMKDALCVIQSKLGLDERGKVKWMEGKAIARELKRATFTIKRSHFDDLFASISKGNQDLKTFTNQSIQLEPERRVKNHGKLFSQLREALRSIYGAVRNSLACDCPGAHKVSLRLEKPKLLPRSQESQHLRDSNFQCAISYRMESLNPSGIDEIWSLMLLRSCGPRFELPEMIPPKPTALRKDWTVFGTTTSTNLGLSQLRKTFQAVKSSKETICGPETKPMLYSVEAVMSAFHETTTAFASLPTTVLTTPVQEEHPDDPIDLCKLARKGKSSRSSGCFGFVSNNTSIHYPKFGIYPPSEHENSTSMISLRTVLQDGDNYTAISYAVGLKLAVDISSGVLQLINTSWLPERITSQDIIFPTQDGRPLYSQPFFAKTFLNLEQKPQISGPASRLETLEELMFSLGILLLEILFFDSLDHLGYIKWKESRTKGLGRFSSRKAAMDLLNQVQTLGSPNFYSAVRRILLCEFTCLDFSMGDEPFCKEVYGKTIALMEEDFKLSQSLW